MIEVKFYEEVDDTLLSFAVMISKYQGKWVLCKHRQRDTFECPGGRREVGETILETAKRELYEETGAAEYTLYPICAYSVLRFDEIAEHTTESFGMLYFSDIKMFGELPSAFEMERIQLFSQLPENWTYPEVQPYLLGKAADFWENMLGN